MSLLRMWAKQEGISPAAVARLEALLGVSGVAVMGDPNMAGEPGSESRQQSLIRLEAGRNPDVLLWRNNVGAFKTEEGGFLRYGLANESQQMNDAIKSSDLIGIRRKLVTPAMVGSMVGIFTARECKKQDWKYRASDKHARAQLTFIETVNAYGGDAAFATGPGTL